MVFSHNIKIRTLSTLFTVNLQPACRVAMSRQKLLY